MLRKLTTMLTLTVLALSVAPALAGSPEGGEGEMVPRTTILVNGEIVLKFRASADDYTPEERWTIANKRLVQIMEELVNDSPTIRVEKVNNANRAKIYVEGKLFVTATSADARANNTRSAYNLANKWVENLRRGLRKATAGSQNDGVAGGL